MSRVQSGTPRGIGLRAAAASLCLALTALALAAFASIARADDDLPARVGRVANVQAPLYHAPDESAGEWSEIGLNYPIAQGDNLWVDRDGHAEVDYGGGQFRMAGDTNLHVSRLDEGQLALFVASGRVIMRVRYFEPGDSVRVDTPSTQIALTRPGLYRVDVVADPAQTTLIVREGDAEIATPAGSQQVLPGQTAVLSGTTDVAFDVFNGGGIDGFDTWSAARDRVYEQPTRNAYVSPQMVGQADLDAYGTWQSYPRYGGVWFPTVNADWAPYRFGRWTWLPGWGYAWVDDAPWGYAPFHYGRWVYFGGRWGWCPGVFVARPLWAPALVAWYGGGDWSYSSAFGAPVYGWVPLGWGEPYVPGWRGCSAHCRARYNRPYAVNVAEGRDAPRAHYANWSVPGGVTAIPGATLANGKPVAINRVRLGSDVAFAPSLVAAAPVQRPASNPPAAMRPGSAAPPPASTAYAARVPSAPSAGHEVRTVPGVVAPPPSRETRSVPGVPGATTPAVAAPTRVAPLPSVPPTPAPVAAPRASPPGPRIAAPPPSARQSLPDARVVPPPATAHPRSISPGPIPQVVPAPQPPAAPLPGAPRVVPAPVPPQGAVAPPQGPVPPAAERVRVIPKPADRPN